MTDNMMTSEATVSVVDVTMTKGKQTKSLRELNTVAPCLVIEKPGSMRSNEGTRSLEYDALVVFDPPIDVYPSSSDDHSCVIEITSGRLSGSKFVTVHCTRHEWNTTCRVRRYAQDSGQSQVPPA